MEGNPQIAVWLIIAVPSPSYSLSYVFL